VFSLLSIAVFLLALVGCIGMLCMLCDILIVQLFLVVGG
jgi:hypothetical protein